MTSPQTSADISSLPWLDRDHCILAFNERVLDWAHRDDVPLLERLRYLCIVSSNLDEFFEVRAAPHLTAALAGERKGLYTVASFEALSVAAHRLVERQYALFNDELMPAFARQGIELVSHGERTAPQKRWVDDYFERQVRPLLVPVGLDPAHPFPQIANKSLNFIVRLGGKDAFGRENEIAIVKVPRVLPRLIRMPAKVSGGKTLFVSLSSVIRAHLQDLFPGREVGQFSQFRVTRHSDLAVDEDDVRNLRTALRVGLQHRHYGQAVRVEVSSGCSEFLAHFLLQQFALPPVALYRVSGPVNLVRLQQLIDLVDAPQLKFPRYTASFPAGLNVNEPIVDQLRRGDVLIHQPFESFDGVLAFLREAVDDPDVLAIKQTIYRTGNESALMDLLREAVRRGKEVMAVVELKARFDEEANINWAEQLESIGAQVVYGVVGLKTHAKMLLVTRREGRALVRYAHLSTGNYNPSTARLYTDLSYLTADPKLTADVEAIFVHLASQTRLPRLNCVLMAPFHLHRRLIEKIDVLGEAAARGLPARIVLKMNALTDEQLMHALVRAGRHGAHIDLIIRGACMLPPGLPGWTDNIRVRSVVGRFLEHSRVFYLRAGSEEELFLSSADWMNRNMLRRIELAWPVTDPVLRQRIVDECLVAYLHDDRDAWELQSDGRYEPVRSRRGSKGHGAQQALMARHGVRAIPQEPAWT
ncbi:MULTISPECIES: polyphosphate kinase 1 [Ramlibacter]|uniref:Polyphosphate kinase n=1 Tax=Ramlibacter pinisoli TaxID=2682844 RepID=A0A6N8IW71_9BURK|nr:MULTISPECIES: polyphosphate kinase 1 [Ramlibacter]MBA2961285.1 polyphosphate kinase 1 [Ramlibacter sp. CGMCC 1.13660]MVQ31229.1 polyphosphate kinase 1 [Ramlibacter pinisoli]